MKPQMWLCILFLAISGCRGDRLTSVVDRVSPDGRWTADGTLVRSYNASLASTADAVLAHSKEKKWFLLRDERNDHKATIVVKTRELVRVEFFIWAPANKATELGIRYNGGDRAGSIVVFEDLERVLRNKRITVNQP